MDVPEGPVVIYRQRICHRRTIWSAVGGLRLESLGSTGQPVSIGRARNREDLPAKVRPADSYSKMHLGEGL